MDYPKVGNEPFHRLIALHKITKGTFEEWHDAIGKKHAYPCHFMYWCTKQVEKGTALLQNGIYSLAPQLVKYFDDYLAAQEAEKIEVVPSRLTSVKTHTLKGYAAAMTRHLPVGAIREIYFINGDTEPEKFRGGDVKNVL